MIDRTVVFTNGCFDLIHRGHIELLRYCRSLGEVVVGLNSDSSVKRLKGNKRPIVSEQDRKLILESLIYVQKVIIFDEDTPYRLIRELKPDIIVKGGDYSENEVIGRDLSQVKIFNFLAGYSTSGLINRLLINQTLPDN